MKQSSHRGGFTLVELLITIGIIIVLIGILIPVIGRVQVQAQTAATQAQMQRISAGINSYYQDFRAYPGIIPDSRYPISSSGVGGLFFNDTTNYSQANQRFNPSEDLVMCLLGGYGMSGGRLNFNTGAFGMPDYLGSGPTIFNPNMPGKKQPYIDLKRDELPSQLDKKLGQQDTMPQLSFCQDTPAPEFLDSYAPTSRRPILYLRANAGARASVAGGTIYAVSNGYNVDYQYNYAAIRMYLNGGGTAFNDPLAATFATPAIVGGTPNVTAKVFTGASLEVTRNAGSYILLSAGADHKFGTDDDLIFGGGGGQ